MFVHPVPPHSVFTVRSDGSDLHGTGIPYGYFGRTNVHWSSNGNSIYLLHHNYPIKEFSVAGALLSDGIGFTGPDLDVLPDDKFGYMYAGQDGYVALFDPTTGASQTLNFVPYASSTFDIAYSESSNSLLWVLDSIVGITNIQTGTQTILSEKGEAYKRFHSAAGTKNGYLAYVAQLASVGLTTESSSSIQFRSELRLINAGGTEERRLVLDF